MHQAGLGQGGKREVVVGLALQDGHILQPGGLSLAVAATRHTCRCDSSLEAQYSAPYTRRCTTGLGPLAAVATHEYTSPQEAEGLGCCHDRGVPTQPKGVQCLQPTQCSPGA